MKNFFKSHVKLCIAVLALSLVTVGATLALMVSQSNSVINSFTTGDVNTHIDEVLTNGNKQVTVVNDGPSDAYVRARIMVSGVNPTDVMIVSDKNQATDDNKVYLVMGDGYTADSWKWEKDGTAADAYYYYLSPLKKGDQTTKLLEKVVIGKNLQTDEFLANFTVTIYHESVLAIDQPAEGESVTLNMVKGAFTAAENSAS